MKNLFISHNKPEYWCGKQANEPRVAPCWLNTPYCYSVLLDGLCAKGGHPLQMCVCVCARTCFAPLLSAKVCIHVCVDVLRCLCGGRWTNPRVRLSGLTETICSAAKCGDRTHARAHTPTHAHPCCELERKQKVCVAWGKGAANTVQPLITPDWGWDCDLLSSGHDWLNRPAIHLSIHSCLCPSSSLWPPQWRWSSC